MFAELEKINSRPGLFEYYTADDLWTEDHTSAHMLNYHLDSDIDVSSRNKKFIEGSVGWIIDKFNLSEGKSVADFGCGPGLYSHALAQSGAAVTGIDFSARSIEYAKMRAAEESVKVEYVYENYLEYNTDKKFDLITMIMCDFCALSIDQRRKILDKFSGMLKDGGAVLLDVYSMTAYSKRVETAVYQENLLDGFWSPEKYFGFLNVFIYDEQKVVLDKYTIIENDRSRVVYNWLSYFSVDQIKDEFARSGLIITEFFSDVAGGEYSENNDEFAIVATKSLL